MILDCLALSRLKDGCVEWLIVSGFYRGNWTRFFGSNCIADSKEFVHWQHCQFPNSTISQVKVEYCDPEELFDNPQMFDMTKIPDKTKILVKPEEHNDPK